MPISAPPTIPQITDPSTFATRAQDWVVWQANELYPALEDSSTVLSLSTSSTSTTSNTIGTGSKSFTVETGKGYLAGQSLSIAYTTTPTNRMFAVVTSYNSGTGALVVNVQAIEGSGTFTDWSIALAFSGVISTSQIGANAVTLAKLARVGTAGQVLTSGGAGADPSYSAIADASPTVKGIVELATSAEIKTGTDGEMAIVPSELLAAQGFTAYFQSAQQTITLSGSLTIAHSLTRKPTLYKSFLVNVTDEAGYSIGDEIPFVGGDGDGGRFNILSIVPNTTNLVVRYGSSAPSITNKTTGAQVVAITLANWRLVIRAWG